jgi:hypothetical protein
MSSSTSTPAALSSDARALASICWRLVEAQYHVSTLKLVDSVAEQEPIEDLIEMTKPPLPLECRDLHYLLSTPFRYGAVTQRIAIPASRNNRGRVLRFGNAADGRRRDGVLSPAVLRRNAHAVAANPAEYTAFSAEYGTKKAIDLTKGKYGADRTKWMHVTDYSHCQALAETARAAKIEVIRYASVRDPGQGMNFALLTCRAFARPKPIDQQTWHIRLSDAGAQAICEAPKSGITFDRKSFAADPRIAKLRWVRA